MEIVLVRHGQSRLNLLNSIKDTVYIGQIDTDLSIKGRKQARMLLNNPALIGSTVIYSSDLKRAVNTVKPYANRHHINIQTDIRLRERSLGDFEGKLISSIKRNPKYAYIFSGSENRHFRHSFKVRIPNGENYTDVENRVRPFIEELLDNPELKEQKIIISAHFCTIRCILKVLNNLSEEETLKLKIKNSEPIVWRN